MSSKSGTQSKISLKENGVVGMSSKSVRQSKISLKENGVVSFNSKIFLT